MIDSSVETVKSIHHGLYTMEYRSNGILYVSISGSRPETIEDTIDAICVGNELIGFSKTPMLFRHDDFALPSPEVRKYLAKKESNPCSIAEAYLVTTFAFKLLAQFYLKYNKPERPTKLFTNVDDAERWLSTFI